MLQADIFFIFKWWGVLFLAGLTFFPLTSKIFTPFTDKGYIFSKIIGICLVSYSVYVLGSMHVLSFNTLNIFIVWVIFLMINLLIAVRNKSSTFFPQSIKLTWKNEERHPSRKLRGFKKVLDKITISNIRILVFEEFIFLSSLFLWSYIKSFNPDIHDLEKFMDFGFINSILRSEYFPPRDIWLTPFSINYYYFGHLFAAVLTKLSGIPSYITFNLMLASIFAFCFSGSFSIGINLINKLGFFSIKKTIIVGLIIAYIVSFSGNLQTIYSLFNSYQGEKPPPFWTLTFSPEGFPNSFWYPSATRFIYHTIHEFPSYSFVVADLHGHVLSIPIVLILIAFSFVLLLEKKSKVPILILSSFFLSVAYMTNAWDGIIYLGLFTNILLFQEFIRNRNKNLIKKFIYSLLGSLKYIFPVLVLFFVFTFIFNRNFSPFASGIGLICSPSFLIDIEKLGPFLFEEGQCEHTPFWQFFILYGFFIFMLTSFVIFLRGKKLLISDGFVLIISFFSILLIIVPEVFYLKDIYSSYFRANTMFKLSYQAFIMLSISSAYVFARIISSFKKDFKGKVLKIPFIAFAIIGFCLIFIVSVYPYFAIPSGYGDLKKYKYLNGIKYLEDSKPGDYSAINWINQNIKGQPVILEAQGDSYTDYARVSSNTGLPTVLGWTVHEWLWRGTYDIPSARFDDIKNIYESTDLNITKRILDKYSVKYVYVGRTEKDKYKILNEDKFLKLGKVVYSNLEVKIYEIN